MMSEFYCQPSDNNMQYCLSLAIKITKEFETKLKKFEQ